MKVNKGAFYSEWDSKKAAWLRELIRVGAIAPGDVDERSIKDIKADELRGYTQCHFFAGIGVWSYALRQAGWSDDREVWTGSCPCQSFSVAGQRKGFADERHLWPDWFRLIAECRPRAIFGEQSASKDALAWLDLVQTNLETANYACAALDIPARGFGTSHKRSRLYFAAYSLADTDSKPGERRTGSLPGEEASLEIEDGNIADGHSDGSEAGIVADSDQTRRERNGLQPLQGRREDDPDQKRKGSDGGVAGPSSTDVVVDSVREGSPLCEREALQREGRRDEGGAVEQSGDSSDERLPGPTNGFWRDVDWLLRRDGKWRPVEPSTFPLAHGTPARVGRLRGYGDAIVAPAAITFIEAFREVTNNLIGDGLEDQ